MTKIWKLKKSPELKDITTLASALKVDLIIASILLNRGVTNYSEAEQFFNPRSNQLHDPYLMKNMEKAVQFLQEAIEKQQSVLLYGDYDVDGTTSVAMMHTFLVSKLNHLSVYVPDRYAEGYGVSEKAIDLAIENKIDKIITLDCGIKNPVEINRAVQNGIQILICDHHEPGEELPDAIILNPKQKDCPYPLKELCGCGVAFKFLQGYSKNNPILVEEINDLVDFVAVGTGADIVSVMDENRFFCSEGLKLLNTKGRPCFDELLSVAGKNKPVTLTDVVFLIAPRINAAGRIYQAKTAVDLMISSQKEEIQKLAKEIQAFNVERRTLDEQTTSEALKILESQSDFKGRKSTVVSKEGWSKGVVGIVASRLIEKHFRPTIVLAEDKGYLTGSARTVNDFDIHAALTKCSDLFVKFGGHTHAAGLTLEKDKVFEFQQRFESIVCEQLDVEDLQASLTIDEEIDFKDIFKPGEQLGSLPRMKKILDRMEPHGPQNMNPVFVTRSVYSVQVNVLKEKHLKMTVCQDDGLLELPAIGFNLGHFANEIVKGVAFDMAYTLESNTWKGNTTLQLNIKDIHFSE